MRQPTSTLPAPTSAPATPEPIRGVVRLTARQLRFQRRVTLLVTVLPLAGLAMAIYLLWGTGISGVDLGLLLGFYTVTGLGVTVGYHRLFTHRSFRAVKPARVALAVAGSLSVEGGVIDWCATHRRHHAFATSTATRTRRIWPAPPARRAC